MITLKQLTDSQLVAIYQKNKEAAYFGELYNRYFQKVYYYCLGKVKDREDAYDITANTFLKLAEKVDKLRNPELFIAWLFKIANNACIDCGKSKGKMVSQEQADFYDFAENEEDLENVILKEDQLIKLDVILELLDYETKTLLMDKYFKGKSVEQLEQEMGLSKSAVKMRLNRGRMKIAKMWDQHQVQNRASI